MERYLKAGQFVEIYENPDDTEKCAVGFVAALDGEWIIMRHIHPTGQEDGYTCRRVENIYRVNVDTRYMRALGLLIGQDETRSFPGENLRLELLQMAQETGMPVQIELMDSGLWNVTGFVEEAGECVRVHMITDEGDEDGFAVCKLEDVAEIWCGDEQGVKLKKLAEKKGWRAQ